MASRKNQAKQVRLDARAAQIRAQAQREARTRNIVIAVFAVLIIGGAGVLYFLTNPPSFITGNNASSSSDVKIGQVQTIADEGRDHIGSTATCVDPPTYKHNPPSSGCHDPVPAPWGVADPSQPVPAKKFVHNMEHGGVVLLYKCSGAQCQQLAQLAQQIGQALPPVPVTTQPGQPSSEIKFLATPYQDMPQQAVLLSWTHQEDLQDLSANQLKAITDFYNQFAGKPPAGEPLNP